MKVDPIPIEQVMAAGAQDQLGALLESIPFSDANTFRRTAGRRVHRFEFGLVVPTKQGPLTLPYRDLRVYREETHHVKNRTIQYIDTQWVFQRRDGKVWKTLLQRGGRESDDSALAGAYEQALTATCVQQRDEVLQRLAEGATLSFGPVGLDLSQLTIGRQAVPWKTVIGFSVNKGSLVVRASRDDRWVKHQDHMASIAAIPNFPLLWSLVHGLHRQAPPDG